jgi:hypothetical protein
MYAAGGLVCTGRPKMAANILSTLLRVLPSANADVVVIVVVSALVVSNLPIAYFWQVVIIYIRKVIVTMAL